MREKKSLVRLVARTVRELRDKDICLSGLKDLYEGKEGFEKGQLALKLWDGEKKQTRERQCCHRGPEITGEGGLEDSQGGKLDIEPGSKEHRNVPRGQ